MLQKEAADAGRVAVRTLLGQDTPAHGEGNRQGASAALRAVRLDPQNTAEDYVKKYLGITCFLGV